MNKKFLALAALGSFAGAVLYRSYNKRRQFEKLVNEYEKAIAEILDKAEVTDFERFSDYLLEYYGITAINIDGKVIGYSTDKFGEIITSDDIRKYGNSGYGYDMNELVMFFSSNLDEEI